MCLPSPDVIPAHVPSPAEAAAGHDEDDLSSSSSSSPLFPGRPSRLYKVVLTLLMAAAAVISGVLYYQDGPCIPSTFSVQTAGCSPTRTRPRSLTPSLHRPRGAALYVRRAIRAGGRFARLRAPQPRAVKGASGFRLAPSTMLVLTTSAVPSSGGGRLSAVHLPVLRIRERRQHRPLSERSRITAGSVQLLICSPCLLRPRRRSRRVRG